MGLEPRYSHNQIYEDVYVKRFQVITVSLNTEIHTNLQFTTQRATRAQGREYRYSCTLSLTSALEGVSGERHAPVALPFTPGNNPVPIVKEAG